MLLLDSHVTLWVADDNPRLGRQARNSIIAADRVHVSAATVWELTIKAMLGKLTIPNRLSEHLDDQGLTLLNITAQDTEAIRNHPELVRHDPFDRLILAQAQRAGMQLLTTDTVLLALKQPFICDARE